MSDGYRYEPIKGSGRRKTKPVSDVPDLFSTAEELPATPYAGEVVATMGHSGTVTSEVRAVEEVISGEATARQLVALSLLDRSGSLGMTWKELDLFSGTLHHGKTSSVLSSLHSAGRIVRLAEVRDRCLVYVLPNYVGDRPISPLGTNLCVCGKTLKVSYNFCPYCGQSKST